MASEPIENYGVVGDLHSVALVGMNGSIDFLCFPDFDSPTIFAALLDDERGGRFRIAPALDHARRRQLYLPDTNVLLTRFLSADGVAEISDFMPVEPEKNVHNLVRRVKTVRGEIRFRMECAPRFDYARARHRVERCGDGSVLFVSEGPDRTTIRLNSEVPLTIHEGDAVAEFTLPATKTAAFVLELAADDPEPCTVDVRYVAEAFKATANFWRAWISRCTYRGRWQEMVRRSALTLKLLTSAKHGSMVAAPTFGLPEHPGGERNWDYRYTWIRDSSFTIYALLRLGFTEEAGRFMDWFEKRCGEMEPAAPLRVLYGLDGRHELPEEHLDHLAGYLNSRPVRIGNGAYDQLQLDVYGELLDAVYLYDKHGAPISWGMWNNLVRLLDWLADNWRQADEGVWEVRGGRHEFVFSRLLCWVAFDRAMRLAEKRSLPGPLARWRKIRDEIHHEIHTDFWNEKGGHFRQAKEWNSVDAATLLMPLVRFISPTDPRWLSTLRAIEDHLIEDSLVFRYQPDKAVPDGLYGTEGTFSMCTFWYVECLSRSGDLDKARFFFEKMLGYANHLGLYGEELGPTGEHQGNFPQAFTHMALISAAYDLDRRLTARRKPQ